MGADIQSSDVLTVEERFFLHIALKNGLVAQADADVAVRECGDKDVPLEQALVTLRFLDEAQVKRVREAMAASQVVRLDSVYADVARARGVAAAAIEAAQQEQRRQRFRVRIGNLLVDGGHIPPEVHRAIISEVIRRLRHEGPGAYTSTVERRGADPRALEGSGLEGSNISDMGQASMPRPSPHAGRTTAPRPDDGSAAVARPSPLRGAPSGEAPFGISVDDGRPAPAPTSARWSSPGPPTGWSEPDAPTPPASVSIPLRSASDMGEVRGGSGDDGPFAESGDSSGWNTGPVERPGSAPGSDSRPGDLDLSGVVGRGAAERRGLHADPDALLESAIRAGRDQGADLAREDQAALERDLLSVTGVRSPGAGKSFVMDRDALTGSDAGPGGRGRRDRRVLLLAGGGLVGLLLAVVGSLVLAIMSNRGALEESRRLLAQAEAATTPEERQRALALAGDRLADADGMGVNAEQRDELRAALRWRTLEVEALALLAEKRPDDALALLDRREADVPPGAREGWSARRRDAARESALARGAAAEAAGDLPAAVAGYRDARDLGDVRGVAAARLLAMRQALDRRVADAARKALETLDEADEVALVREAKLVTELWNEDPGTGERLEAIALRRALSRGSERLRAGDVDAAERHFETARRLRPQDREVAALLERVARRRSLAAEERRGREAEQAGRLAEAIEFYRQAEALATTDEERRALAGRADDCRARIDKQQDTQRRRDVLQAALQALRESRAQDAVKLLEELEREKTDARTLKLLELARRVDGMVYVAPGPFLMGSEAGAPNTRSNERPRRTVEVPGYFIDRTEVTNAAYARFVAAGKSPAPSHWTHTARQLDGSVKTTFDPAIADHPVINVTWSQARDYALWREGRLPSEPEWEKAARGTDGRTWPWGESTRVRVHIQVQPGRRGAPTAPVGAHADDTSPCGARDMAGNVNEWTGDAFGPYPGAPGDIVYPPARRTIRGGAFRWALDDARCAARDGADEQGYASPTVGFRVVVEVPAEVTPLR